MNKKGADKIMSMYWFVILFIVAGAIVYMVSIFYGEPYDVRNVETEILTSKIASCIVEGGYIKDEIMDSEGFLLTSNNVMDICNLNFEVEDTEGWREQEQYYIEVNFYDFNTKNKLSESIIAGESAWEEYCSELYQSSEGFPFCRDRKMYSLDKQKRQYEIQIITIVRKTEKNVE